MRAVVVMAALMAVGALPQEASAQDRTLSFKHAHTGERVSITYMRNGRYDRDGLRQINHIFRDWRRDEAIEIDPRLLDILWEAYRATGSRAPVTIFSAYRSPATNAALRARSSGVADNSQHTRGRALDFNLPDVPVSRLREVALKFQAGGVGFYPSSGFVHIDTGSVRHWPRLSRQQLANLFPDGKTLHLPADGKPLPGYELAKVAAARGELSAIRSPQATAVASANQGRGLLSALFGGGQQRSAGAAAQPEDPARAVRPTQPAAAPATATASAPAASPAPAQPAAEPQPTRLAELSAPLPTPRPGRTSERTAPSISEEGVEAASLLAGASAPQTRPTVLAQLTNADLPRQRPALTQERAPAAQQMTTGAIEAALALAPSRLPEAELPFAETFTDARRPSRAARRFVGIDLQAAALSTYAAPESSRSGRALARLRHPRPADLSDLPRTHAETLDTRFGQAKAPVATHRFSGAAVAGAASEEVPEPKPSAKTLAGFFFSLFR